MPTKINNLRSESHLAIGQIIERETGTIISRWIARATEEQPKAARVHHAVLLDHIPDFLCHLGRSLAAAGDDSAETRRRAAKHGNQRWDTGWSVTEVVRDYQVLRIVLTEFLEEALSRRLATRESLVLNVVIDDAIAASVAAFVNSQSVPTNSRDQSLELLLNVLGVVGHEFRNPLSPLVNSLEVLRAAANDAAQIEKARQMMERQVRVLNRLVEDMMDLPRLARGKMSLQRVPLDLAQLVRTCAEDRRQNLESAGLALTLDVPPGPVPVLGDETRLTQVFGNLIGNAQKFTDRGGTITVRVSTINSARAIVTVSDTGIGMEASLVPKIFDAYVQADNSPGRSRGGLGLGLALVRGVIELHGGIVAAASDGPGRGSTFTVDMPLDSPALHQQQEGPKVTVPSVIRRVLIIEDNADSAESLRVFLELYGHSVKVASNGPDGVKMACDWHPEIVVCDVGLPGMDGYSVATEIRKQLAPLAIIAVTGFGALQDADGAPDAVFDYYLLKPVDPERIVRILSSEFTPTGKQ